MIISSQYKFVFIHVEKVAGTSVVNYFIDRNIGQSDMFIDSEVFYHSRASQIKELMGDELFSRYFSFAFVRNPWDFEYSWYRFVRKKSSHWYHEEIIRFDSFEQYLKFKYYKQLEDESKGIKRFGAQQKYVCDKDCKQIVSFVGRFENLQEDFGYVLRKLDIPEPHSLEHRNKSTNADFREKYNSRMVEYVAKIHFKDIEYFNYSFE